MKVQIDPEGIAAYEGCHPYRDEGFWVIGSPGIRCARPAANGLNASGMKQCAT